MELEETIFKRRDTRHFLTDPVDPNILEKAIQMANMAPSVGQLKPTRFVLIEDMELKKKIKGNFDQLNALAEITAKESGRDLNYRQLKLEGILEAPIGLVICCDFSVLHTFSIGTISKPREMLLASTSCSIHTLWLYLTQCGLSMGWVSILDFEELSKILELPEDWFPMGYFCIGKPATHYKEMPMLSLENWNTHLNPPVILRK
jgi:nicotinate-nucleotide--dimethylbenzimidazole phosphoribosyltransferase